MFLVCRAILKNFILDGSLIPNKKLSFTHTSCARLLIILKIDVSAAFYSRFHLYFIAWNMTENSLQQNDLLIWLSCLHKTLASYPLRKCSLIYLELSNLLLHYSTKTTYLMKHSQWMFLKIITLDVSFGDSQLPALLANSVFY